ncbi:MAG TPA: CPXCG motif-containing cysteine-rich protein [Steroidobacteraceae bacterium]|nr:CPXCG motif-containing cysteine-rich protein [Steroidobacteraceae bacterium]
MGPPEKSLTDAEVDELYGLEPVIGDLASQVDTRDGAEFVVVHCPYCGEAFETNADCSAGPSKYVEDCQICCQPIDMELRVDDSGGFLELLASRGDS